MMDVVEAGSFLGHMAGMKLKDFWLWSSGGARIPFPYHFHLAPIETSRLVRRILLQSHQHTVALLW